MVILALVLLVLPAVPAMYKYAALPVSSDKPVTLLLAGTTPNYVESAPTWPWPAAPEDYTGLTDTIMLAQFQPSGKVELLSIPRDTWVSQGQYGMGKINAVNKRLGPDELVNTVQNLVGVPIQGYALLSLNALRDLTDASGGVTLNVPERMKYDDNAGHLHVDLQPGEQHLTGEQVEGFLRFRHDALSDIGRVGRQQLFLQALSQKLSSPLNWWRMPRVISALDHNTKTNINREVVAQVLGALKAGHNINSQTLPGRFGEHGSWQPDYRAIRQMTAQHFTDPNDPRTRSVAIANIDAPDGSARALQDKLRHDGYTNVWIADLPRAPLPITKVVGAGPAEQGLQQAIGYGEAQEKGGAQGADLTVLLGSDTPKP